MIPIAETISLGTTLEEAAELFASRKLLGAPVLDDSGHLFGVLTEADIIRLIHHSFHGLPRLRFITWRAHTLEPVDFIEGRKPDSALKIRQTLRATRTAELVPKVFVTARPTNAFEGVARQMLDTVTTLVAVVEGDRVTGTIGYDSVARAIYRGLGESLGG